VLVSHNTRDDLLRALGALHSHARVALEAIVVDNASADGSAEAVRRAFPAVHLIANAENVGFGRANNQALRLARAPFVLLLNPDCEVRPGAVEALIARLEAQPDVGAVAPRTLNEDGTPQVSFGPALGLLAEWRQRRLVDGVRRRDPRALARADALTRREHEPDWVSAACLLARAEALRAVGGFDEDFFLYEEDADLCLRLRRAGWRIVHSPTAEALHRLGRSTGQAPARTRLLYQESHLVYYGKHCGTAQTLALRLTFVAEALAGLLLGRGPGADAAARRAYHRALLHLALRG
jgi:hypothetical protein